VARAAAASVAVGDLQFSWGPLEWTLFRRAAAEVL
jgi:hypothetical protein